MSQPVPLDDLLAAASSAAEAHVGACSSWLYESEELEVDDWPPSPAVDAFDSCDTCVIREALAAAWPVFVAGVLAQLRSAGEMDAASAATLLERELPKAPPLPLVPPTERN